MLTLFIRGVPCNRMVSTGVVAAMISTSVSGRVIAMWLPILVFFYMGFEHSIVNLLGGLSFVGLTTYAAHARTGPSRNGVSAPEVEAPVR